MRKVLCGLIGISLLFSCGCVTKVSQITYSSEEAEAVIKEVYVEDFKDGDCSDGDWFITVEYDGMNFVDSGCIKDGIPEFTKMNIGDVVTIEIENEYIDGRLSKRHIERIIE